VSEVSAKGIEGLPAVMALRAEGVCRRFETAWRAGQQPRIEDFLEGVLEVLRTPLLHELVEVEVECRLQLGEVPAFEEYHERFPGLEPSWLVETVGAPSSDSSPEAADAAVSSSAACAPVVPADGSAISGRCLGDYELLGEIARGGMGVVYKARQKRLNRIVAIKAIRSGPLASLAEVRRFRIEAENAAHLDHPHIVPIYEVGDHLGLSFFSMKFIEGGTLAEHLDRFDEEPKQAARLLATVAEAVDHAHRHGILHRDLKPANILLDAEGEPHVSDFGLAKELGGEGKTASGAIVGTPSYMAPEQAAGGAKRLSTAADIYALGAILYELLTGRPPFHAETPLETLRQVQSAEPVPPARLRPKLPRDLTTICLKCLEKEPATRYGSAGALAEDLRRFLDGKPIRARPVGHAERLWRWCRRNPAVAWLTFSTAFLVGAAAVNWVIATVRLREAERNAREKVWQARLAQAQAGRRSGFAGQRFGGLAALAEAADIVRTLQPADREAQLITLRNEAIACLALVDLRMLRDWQVETPCGFDVAFDTALERYAYSDDRGTIIIREAANHREVARLPGPGRLAQHVAARISRDGRWLAVMYWELPDSHYRLWDLSTPEPVGKLRLQANELFLGFSADSRFIAVRRSDNFVWLHDLIGGGERRLGPAPDWPRVAFRPDGKELAFSIQSANQPEVHIVDVETGAERAPLHLPTNIVSLAWGDGGRLLATGCDDGNIYAWDVPGNRLQAVMEGHRGWVTTLAFHPAGDLLASTGADHTTRLWDPVSGRHLVTAPGCCIDFSSDGTRLAFHDGSRIGIWELADANACRLLHPGRVGNRTTVRAGLEDLAFSPAGNLLAAAGEDGVRLWDTTGEEIAYLRTGRHETALFQPRLRYPETDLFTYGRNGLHRWAIRPDPDGPARRLRIGPPQRLNAVDLTQSILRAAISGDGRVIAVNDFARRQVAILTGEELSERVVIGNCPYFLGSMALSADGRWLAAGVVGRNEGVRIWDARIGRLVRSLPGSTHEAAGNSVAFSPDGCWLVVGSHRAFQLWRTESWEAGPVFSRGSAEDQVGFAAFTRDGRVLALTRSLQSVQLIDLASRRELATLSAPDVAFPINARLTFNADGSLLAAVTERTAIRIWDLRALRRQLRRIGLDWEPGSPAPAAPQAKPLPPAVVFHATVEAENLPILHQKDCQTEIQDMAIWRRENWGNGHQLLCATHKEGYVELGVAVPKSGVFQLKVHFTRAPNYGVVQVSMDGKPVGQPVDGFQPRVVPSARVELGEVYLVHGEHRLRFEAVDKNPQSTGFLMGLDCVELLPRE
jgi:WD40 repeat protein/tRNA A-37 threonylcarbamoyl transferase component Bud32